MHSHVVVVVARPTTKIVAVAVVVAPAKVIVHQSHVVVCLGPCK